MEELMDIFACKRRQTRTSLLEDWMRMLQHFMRTSYINENRVQLFYVVHSLSGTGIGYLRSFNALYVKFLLLKVIQFCLLCIMHVPRNKQSTGLRMDEKITTDTWSETPTQSACMHY